MANSFLQFFRLSSHSADHFSGRMETFSFHVVPCVSSRDDFLCSWILVQEALASTSSFRCFPLMFSYSSSCTSGFKVRALIYFELIFLPRMREMDIVSLFCRRISKFSLNCWVDELSFLPRCVPDALLKYSMTVAVGVYFWVSFFKAVICVYTVKTVQHHYWELKAKSICHQTRYFSNRCLPDTHSYWEK